MRLGSSTPLLSCALFSVPCPHPSAYLGKSFIIRSLRPHTPGHRNTILTDVSIIYSPRQHLFPSHLTCDMLTCILYLQVWEAQFLLKDDCVFFLRIDLIFIFCRAVLGSQQNLSGRYSDFSYISCPIHV